MCVCVCERGAERGVRGKQECGVSYINSLCKGIIFKILLSGGLNVTLNGIKVVLLLLWTRFESSRVGLAQWTLAASDNSTACTNPVTFF